MILIIISFIVIPIILKILDCFCYTDCLYDFKDFLCYIFGVTVILAAINGIAFISEIGYEVTATYEEKQYNISGLENKTSQEFNLDGSYGNFFCIGYGKMHAETNTEMNYYYFKDCEYGKVLESVPMEETYIREKEDVIPSLIWIVEERLYKGHPQLHKWFLSVSPEDRKQGIKTGTILEVPINTIKIEYNVDI